jgi:hypothetical protein
MLHFQRQSDNSEERYRKKFACEVALCREAVSLSLVENCLLLSQPVGNVTERGFCFSSGDETFVCVTYLWFDISSFQKARPSHKKFSVGGFTPLAIFITPKLY